MMNTINKYIFGLLCGLTLLFPLSTDASVPDRKLIIRGRDNYPPFEYINASNEPDGFNVDIIKKLMEELNYDYELKLES